MKNIFVFLFLVSMGLIAGPDAIAQQTQGNGFKIAIINVDMIRRNAAAVQDIRNQISTFRTTFQADIQKEEDALRKAQQEVARQRTILSPEAFETERRKFEQSVVAVQRKVQKRKQTLDQAQSMAMAIVEKKVNEVVAELVKEHKLSLILKKTAAVFATPQLNISQAVLDLLNKQLPKVKVQVPGK